MAWVAALACGVSNLLRYEMTPAEVVHPSGAWPAESTLHLDANRPTLVMFVHPRCPCSRASLDELAVLSHQRETFRPTIVFVVPPGFDADWAQTDLWRSAKSIPDAIVVVDPTGIEAARFQASTSGETLLYDTTGRLLFHGGLTASRGHRGESAGRDAVERHLAGLQGGNRESPVFGCSLRRSCCTHAEVSPPETPLRLEDERQF